MKIARWGNSLALRIPKDVVKALDLKEGDDVDIARGRQGGNRGEPVAEPEELIPRPASLPRHDAASYRFDRDEANGR